MEDNKETTFNTYVHTDRTGWLLDQSYETEQEARDRLKFWESLSHHKDWLAINYAIRKETIVKPQLIIE